MFGSMLLLLIVPIDVVVVIQSIKNNKTGVSILIEFPWWSAIIGLLLLLLLINYTYLLCNNFRSVFETFQKINNE